MCERVCVREKGEEVQERESACVCVYVCLCNLNVAWWPVLVYLCLLQLSGSEKWDYQYIKGLKKKDKIREGFVQINSLRHGCSPMTETQSIKTPMSLKLVLFEDSYYAQYKQKKILLKLRNHLK